MKLTWRWWGPTDTVPLAKVRQIPGIEGIVTALYDVPAGDVWPLADLEALRDEIERHGFRFAVVESIPVHEDIKLGRPSRDCRIDSYCRSIEHLGRVGVPVLCYNFMPVVDWIRTDLAMPMDDGSTALAYDHEVLARLDLSAGLPRLPAWATGYDGPSLAALIAAYRDVGEEQLWENLAYFLERIAPVADASGVKLAIHPDDPPWPVFGIPRIITTGAAMERVADLVPSPANGVTFCTGALGALPENDLAGTVRRLGSSVHFVHCRNVRTTGPQRFHEVPHPSRFGDVDMLGVLRALQEIGYTGPCRPDHGRMIWGEEGRAGYGLHDRALGAMYLQGLWEAVAAEPVVS